MEPPKFSGREIICLVRGLAFVLAGLVCGVACVAMNQISPLSALLGRHLLGMPLAGTLLWFGTASLQRITTLGEAWCAVTKRCFWAAICVCFLSPFVYLWHREPSVDYLTFNFILFNLSSAVFVCNVNRLAYQLGDVLDDRLLAGLARGSELFCYSTLSFTVGACAVGSWIVAMREGISVRTSVDMMLAGFGPWLVAVGMAPVCVTAALLWTAKAISLARFAAQADAGERH